MTCYVSQLLLLLCLLYGHCMENVIAIIIFIIVVVLGMIVVVLSRISCIGKFFLSGKCCTKFMWFASKLLNHVADKVTMHSFNVLVVKVSHVLECSGCRDNQKWICTNCQFRFGIIFCKDITLEFLHQAMDKICVGGSKFGNSIFRLFLFKSSISTDASQRSPRNM